MDMKQQPNRQAQIKQLKKDYERKQKRKKRRLAPFIAAGSIITFTLAVLSFIFDFWGFRNSNVSIISHIVTDETDAVLSTQYSTDEELEYTFSSESDYYSMETTYGYSVANMVFFNNNTGSAQPVVNSTLHITEIERVYEQDVRLEYTYDGNTIRVYAVNNGYGNCSDFSFQFDVFCSYREWNMEAQEFQGEDFYYSINDISVDGLMNESHSVSVQGAGAILVDELSLSAEKITAILEQANSDFIEVHANTDYINDWGEQESYLLGRYYIEDGEIICDGGGGGGPMAVTESCVYIDVEQGVQSIDMFTLMDRQVVGDAELFLISLVPNYPCRLVYYMEFEVGNNHVQTETKEVELRPSAFLNYGLRDSAPLLSQLGIEEFVPGLNAEWDDLLLYDAATHRERLKSELSETIY